jgi:hypothetical protein
MIGWRRKASSSVVARRPVTVHPRVLPRLVMLKHAKRHSALERKVMAKEHFGIPRRVDAAQKDAAAPLNWRRGLLRLWLLLSGAWITAWTIYVVLEGIQGGLKSAGELLALPVLLFGPPIALLLFGLAAGWAFRGFNSDKVTSGD